MLTCVVNLSEGRDETLLRQLATPLGPALLDRHSDVHHNRSVFTLGGPSVYEAAIELATATVRNLDLRRHVGAHPRLGVLDVVPFVPVGVALGPAMDLSEALEARGRFGQFAADRLGLSCFFYGPERSLPAVRRHAFVTLAPDLGPLRPSARSGAVCVGARPPLIAYNLYLEADDLELARRIAAELRSASVRSLGFRVGDAVQVSVNLIAPWETGPAEVYDFVAARAAVARAELVGLVPAAVLDAIPPERLAMLDLAADRTVEARMTRAGFG